MNSKMTTNSQLSTTEPKKQNKNKILSKQLEQVQNHENDHMGVIGGEVEEGEWGKRYRE